MYVLLLTACINPDGMLFTKLSDKEVRKQQYLNALNFYLDSTSYPIVFTENSNTDISAEYKGAIDSGRLEILTFEGNMDKTKGKGYGEALIIEYALNHSKLITSQTLVAKITGRLIIENINAVLMNRFPLSPSCCVNCSLNSDLSFPDSRIFIAPISFLHEFIEDKEQMNDSEGVFFEHVLSKHILKGTHPYAPFWIEPIVNGSSGSTGQTYPKPENNKLRTVSYRLLSLRQYRLYSKITGTLSIQKHIAYYIIYSIYKIYKKIL